MNLTRALTWSKTATGVARDHRGHLHRRFRFLGDAGVWRLLASAARDA